MKRRGFLGWVLGLGAAPIAAAVADNLPKEVDPTESLEDMIWDINPQNTWFIESAPVSTQRFTPSSEYDQSHGIKTCVHCGARNFGDYLRCANCDAEDWA